MDIHIKILIGTCTDKIKYDHGIDNFDNRGI